MIREAVGIEQIAFRVEGHLGDRERDREEQQHAVGDGAGRRPASRRRDPDEIRQSLARVGHRPAHLRFAPPTVFLASLVTPWVVLPTPSRTPATPPAGLPPRAPSPLAQRLMP